MLKLETVHCDLCGCNDERFLYTNHDRIHNIEGLFRIVQCNHCGLIYVNPRPTLESIACYYPSNYEPYQQTSSKQVSTHNFIMKALKGIYHLVSLKPLLGYIEVKNTILPRIYRVNQKTRLLDIGCATGNFLRRYREKLGCEVYGVEIDKAAANYARNHSGICVHNGDFLTNNFRSSFFDCITMWWFLEHTHSPTSVLKEAKRILTRDGIVVIGIPNGQSIGRYLFREKWYAYDTPRHLYIFSPRTIQQLLQKTGFKVVGVKYDYSTWDLMGSLQYLLFHEKYLPGKRVQNVQENRIAQLLMMPLGLVSGLLRIAGIMVVYAEKC